MTAIGDMLKRASNVGRMRAKASCAGRFGIAAMQREVPVVRQSCDANVASLSLSQRDDGIAFHRGLVLLSQHHEIPEVQS